MWLFTNETKLSCIYIVLVHDWTWNARLAQWQRVALLMLRFGVRVPGRVWCSNYFSRTRGIRHMLQRSTIGVFIFCFIVFIYIICNLQSIHIELCIVNILIYGTVRTILFIFLLLAIIDEQFPQHRCKLDKGYITIMIGVCFNGLIWILLKVNSHFIGYCFYSSDIDIIPSCTILCSTSL